LRSTTVLLDRRAQFTETKGRVPPRAMLSWIACATRLLDRCPLSPQHEHAEIRSGDLLDRGRRRAHRGPAPTRAAEPVLAEDDASEAESRC